MCDSVGRIRIEPEPEASPSPASPDSTPLRNAHEEFEFLREVWERKKTEMGSERWQRIIEKYPPVVRRMLADFRRIREVEGMGEEEAKRMEGGMRRQRMFDKKLSVSADALLGWSRRS
jgi:hypothetical protein